MTNEIDLETCSWCVCEVPDSTLKDIPDGARLCSDCYTDYKLDPNQIWRMP